MNNCWRLLTFLHRPSWKQRPVYVLIRMDFVNRFPCFLKWYIYLFFNDVFDMLHLIDLIDCLVFISSCSRPYNIRKLFIIMCSIYITIFFRTTVILIWPPQKLNPVDHEFTQRTYNNIQIIYFGPWKYQYNSSFSFFHLNDWHISEP